MGLEDQQEIRERSKDIEAATLPQAEAEIPPVAPLDHYDDYHLKAVNELKKNLNDSLEIYSDQLLQLQEEVAELRERRDVAPLSENDILKVIGMILGNDKLAEYLGQKIRDKFKDKVKVNFEIS